MEFSSILHEPTSRFAFALSKQNFVIRLTTKKSDIAKVTIHCENKYLPLEYPGCVFSVPMEKFASDSYHDYWQSELKIDVVCLRYYFEITDTKGKTSFYGNIDFYDEKIADRDLMFDLPQNLREEELFDIPEWSKNKIVYQIFTARYASSKNIPDSVWYKENLTWNDNFCGDLKGIISKLEYIKDLGIDIVYFTPIFKSPSNHKYDTEDYYEIDPNFGTKEDFRNLVEKAHSLGLKIVLDAVFNHTNRHFFAFNDIIQNGENSKYVNWYYIESFPVKNVERGQKPGYKCFGYYGGMPKTNLSNPEVNSYFIDVAKYWTKEFNIDGWRLDVADEIIPSFWEKFRKEIRKINPQTLICGECWHFSPDWLDGTKWDTLMNYPFYNAVRNFTVKKSITATKFTETLDFIKGNYHPKVYSTLWNLIDSHDTERFLHQADGKKSVQHLAAAFQLLSEGMPMVYYGDEVALNGGHDPDCRRGMLWAPERQDANMLDWYKKLIKVRKVHPVLISGKTTTKTDDEKCLVIYEKILDGKKATVIYCASEKPVKIEQFKGLKDEITGETFTGEISMDAKVFIE